MKTLTNAILGAALIAAAAAASAADGKFLADRHVERGLKCES